MTTTAGPSSSSPHTTRPFRFGVVAPIAGDLSTWRDQIAALTDTGYSTILLPDVPGWHPAPGPALALASALTDARVGTWVYASPVRPPWTTAWEAHSLSVLTEGRFEMGIGTGRPGIADQLHELGLPATAVRDRAAEVRRVVTVLRELDGPDRHTPVTVAAGGPKALAVATELADTINFVMPAVETREQTTKRVQAFDNPRDIELALHVNVIGDGVAPFMAGPDTDPHALRAADSLSYLPGDPAAAAEEIRRRRDEIGFSYFVFGAAVAGSLGPVVAELSGH